MQNLIKQILCTKIVCLLVILTFNEFIIYGQSLEPNWSVSFGNKEHTSRDDLFKVTFDKDSNLIVIGSIERDSSFCDILVQKYTRRGVKLWENRFSSGKSVDYDHPVEIGVDNKNNIIILASFATNLNIPGSTLDECIKGGLILYKLDKNGVHLWKTEIPDFDLDWTYVSRYHFFLAEDNSVSLFLFFNHHGVKDFPIYIIDEEGKISKTNLVSNKNPGRALGVPKLISASSKGAKFILNQEQDKHNYWISEINGTNQTLHVIDSAEIENSKFWKRPGDAYISDKYGNFYIYGNSPDYPEYMFYIFKIATNGKVYKRFFPTGSQKAGVENICISDSIIYMIGRQIDTSEVNYTFIMKLDSSLRTLDSVNLTNLPHFVPQNIVENGNSFYAVLDNLNSDRSIVLELDKTLCQTGQFTLNNPIGWSFKCSNLIKDNKQLFLGGTLRRPKFQGAAYLSENDFYIETFSLTNKITQWSKTITDKGTSRVIDATVYSAKNNTVYVMEQESMGPENYSSKQAVKMFFLLKYDSLGNKLWQVPMDYSILNSLVAIDSHNNFYTLGQKDSKWYLLGITDNGEKKYVFQIESLPRFLYVDRNDRVFVDVSESDVSNQYLLEFDKNWGVRKNELKGRIIQMFELPKNDSIYYYTYDPGDWGGSKIKDIRLYVNHKLRWIRPVNMSSPYDGYKSSGYNKKTGCLYFASSWGRVDKYIQKLTLDNQYSYTTLDNTRDGFLQLKVLSNNNLLINNEWYWELIMEDLSHKSSKTLDFAGNIAIVNNYEFLIGEGRIMVFDNNFEKLGEMYHPTFVRFYTSSSVSDNYNLYQTKIFGQSLPISWTPYMFGYRTYLGGLSQFQLKSKFNLGGNVTSNPNFSITNNVINFGYPVPPPPAQPTEKEELTIGSIKHYLSCNNLVISRSQLQNLPPCEVNLYDINGKKMVTTKWHEGAESISISLENFNEGLYLLQINSQNHLTYRAKIIR